ncbi:MAG: hypothetical protein IT373_31835, partial [Polyangiaceae bacterium]|nr:hypothetical protein [Polyangiaceae bacterium]
PLRLVVSGANGEVLLDGLVGDALSADPAAPPLTGFAVRASSATYETQFGAFKILEPAPGAWMGAVAATDIVDEPGALSFTLRNAEDEAIATAHLTLAAERELSLSFSNTEPGLNRASFGFACRADEHFIGLGGQSFDVDHRGYTVPIWVQEDGIHKWPTDDYGQGLWYLNGRRHTTHTPIPFFVSSRGYGLMLDSNQRSVFALCSEAGDAARVEAWEPDLHLRLFYGPSPKEVVSAFTARVGRPALPPAFTFAPWIDAIFGSVNVRRVAQKLRDEDIPVSVVWTEDFRGGQDVDLGYELDEDWNTDTVLYPDFPVLASDLHAAGYKFLTYNNTFLTSGADVFDEALAAGHAVKRRSGEPYLFTGGKLVDAGLVDLTSPAAWAWTKDIYRTNLELGADGYMADFAEWLPVDDVALASGEDTAAAHNLYPVEFQRLNKEVLDELAAVDGVERLFFVRSAYLGSQPLVSVVWGGDQQTEFAEGDGLASVIPIGLGLGVTGFPYYGSDIAGYMSQLTKPTTKELFFRWVELGALTPVMRTHHGRSAHENWSWESDLETTAHFRRYAKLHQQLFPYLYALAKQAADDGVPMLRTLALEKPDFAPGWSARDVFMLGDRILVAPVVTAGATTRSVALPPGRYYPLLGGAAVEGGQTVELAAPLAELPALVPAGTVLALLPESVDTLVAADAASGAVEAADVGDDRELWLYPGGASEFTEVSGLGYSWDGSTLAGAPSSATFEGAPVAIAPDGSISVTGPGTLVLDGAATLVVTGGAASRALLVRVR